MSPQLGRGPYLRRLPPNLDSVDCDGGAFHRKTKTMLPVIREFMKAHQLPDVTVVADAGMISDANMKAIEAENLSFILGMKVPEVPYVVDAWRREHPGQDIADGHVFTQPWPAGPKDG